MVKKIFVIMLICMIICLPNEISFGASGFDFARTEAAGNYEPVRVESTPADAPGSDYTEPSDSSTPEVVEEPSINICVPTSVDGMVFEDYDKYEKIEDGSMDGTYHITNNYKKDEEEPLIKGVGIYDGTDLLVTTDGENKYSFSGSGKYKIRFEYGKNLNENDYKLNKDTLKYNGQDYSMVFSENSVSGIELNYLRKIKEIEKSFTEVYVLIDYSATMREFTEGDKSRLEIVKASAINFVNSLFEEAEGNLAVGFIAFGYESVIVKRPTNVSEDVVSAIQEFTVTSGVGMYSGKEAPNFSKLNNKVGTNIGGAVRKAKENYLSEKSNKVMVLFSDGAATAHELVESIYQDDTDGEISSKLDRVANYTRSDLKSVVEADISLISILNKTENIEKEYVNKSFKDDTGNWIGSYHEVDYLNEEAVREALLSDVKKEIEESDSEFLNYKEEKDFKGNDNKERRKQVNENYKQIYYEKISLFKIIDKLNGEKSNDINIVSNYIEKENDYSEEQKIDIYKNFISDENDSLKSEVESFIENTWMQTEEREIALYKINYSDGKVSSITCGGETSYTFSYYEKDGIEYCSVNGTEYKVSNVSVSETKINLDGIFIKRDDFKLELEQRITGVRLTLSDGTILYEEISSNAKDVAKQNEEIKKAYCEMLKKASVPNIKNALNIEEVNIYIPDSVTMVVDTDLLQGATLEVEYTFIIKNNSGNATFSNEISIVDYFDDGMVYREDSDLISENGKNSDYGWKVLTTDYLYEKDSITGKGKYVSEDVNRNKNLKCLYVNYTEKGYRQAERISDDGNTEDFDIKSKYLNPVIGNNGQRYAKVVLCRVLGAEILDSFIYRNQAEIIEYSNNNYRRINLLSGDGTRVDTLYSISGNYVPTSFFEKLSDSFTNISEIDTSVSNPVSIIPPTGEKKKKHIKSLAFISVISMSGYGILSIRKLYKNFRKRNMK